MKENKEQLRSAEEIAYNTWRKLVNQNWSNVAGEIQSAIEEYTEQIKAENKALKNECTYLSNQSIAIDKIIFSEDLSIFEKVQEIQKLLI